MSKYKLNIHAHSIFSDGHNTPYVMALKAVELGFSALVLTDHFYPREMCEMSLNKEKVRLRRKACKEAKGILPVILGFEVCYAGNEILVFGGEALNYIVEKRGALGREDFLLMRNTMNCAMVLCHPQEDFDQAAEVCDGYERINGGSDFFKNRALGALESKQAWCNSDAHMAKYLDRCWNVLGSKITTESDLINYIKSGKQHELQRIEADE